MDYYKILNIDEKASQSEIEKAYKLMCDTYNPAYNTSKYAHKKYREVLLAYKMLQNKKILSFEEEKEETIELPKESFDYSQYYSNKGEEEYKEISLKNKDEYKNIEITNNTLLEDFYYKKEIEIDYIEYLLGCQKEITIYQNEPCLNAKTVECDLCHGIGKVLCFEDVIKCPKCKGKKEIYVCYCHFKGGIKKEEKFVVDLKKIEDGQIVEIDDTLVFFKIINKEKTKLSDKEIYVEYDLSKKEILNGFEKRYYTDEGIIEIKTNDFENDYRFAYKNKNVTLHFNRLPYDGENICKNIIIDKKDLYQTLYFDLDELDYSLDKTSKHSHKIKISDYQGQIQINEKGEKGYLEGKDGDLIINYYVCDKKCDVKNKDIEFIDTSKFDNLFNLGFKGKNHLVENDEKVIIYSGQSKKKEYIKNYLFLKIMIYLMWIIIPFMPFIFPLTEALLLITCVSVFVYSLLANIMLRIKI